MNRITIALLITALVLSFAIGIALLPAHIESKHMTDLEKGVQIQEAIIELQQGTIEAQKLKIEHLAKQSAMCDLIKGTAK